MPFSPTRQRTHEDMILILATAAGRQAVEDFLSQRDEPQVCERWPSLWTFVAVDTMWSDRDTDTVVPPFIQVPPPPPSTPTSETFPVDTLDTEA